MDSKELLFKKSAVRLAPVGAASVATIFNNPIPALPKKPLQIMTVAPVVITVPGPYPMSPTKLSLGIMGQMRM